MKNPIQESLQHVDKGIRFITKKGIGGMNGYPFAFRFY